MSLDSSWDALVRGVQCPFCAPRPDESPFWIKVRGLTVSTLYLDRNQAYRGQSVLVFDRRHVVGLEALAPDEYLALSGDLRSAGRAVATACQPDLMNYASLGNVIPHLHWHLVPRYRSDPRWGGPIYTTTKAEMPERRLSAPAYEELVRLINAAFDAAT